MPIDPKRLLEDMLEDDPTFRSASLDAVLQAVRHRHRARQRRRWSLALGGVMAATAAVIFQVNHRQPALAPPVTPMAARGGLNIVTTVPPHMASLVETRGDAVVWVTTEASSVVQVSTDPTTTPGLDIDDDGLFRLLAGRPAALVRPKDSDAGLLLLGAEGLSATAGP